MPVRRPITGALLCLLAGCQTWTPAHAPPDEPLAAYSDSLRADAAPPLGLADAAGLSEDIGPAANPLREDPPEGIEAAAHLEALGSAAEAEPLPSGMPFDGPASLSLVEVEQLALANNPAVARAAAVVRAARGRWVQAGLPPNPTIGYRGEEIGAGGSAGMQGGFVGQEFITGGKLGLNRAVVAQEIRAAEQRLAAAQRSVLTDVRLTYYEALLAQRRLELTGELVEISQQAVEASRRLLEVGDIPRVGLLQTEVEAQSTLILRRRAENELDAAWRRLTSVTGLPQMQRTHLAGDLENMTIILDFQQQLARLLAESPETAEAVAEVARACWALERAYAEVVPDVSTQAAVLYNDGTGDTVAGVQVSLPLPLWNRNQGGIQEASQEVVAARRNVDRVELSLRERLAAAFRQYADARYQVGMYFGEILPKARETLDLVATGYEAGEVGYLDLLAAQRTYFQTTLAYIDALRDLWQATLQIEGMLLSGSLQEGGPP